ncbi:hypothetical protein ABH15_13440 [Methanoculleus taiwanensis]|uniref:Uncharacterized protein n=1 Tax=Methanoculleus taiwanensis TaxID=1550565 RepID=A0A498GWB0_9EURY|nr:hypothetical protein [Methanoculleus taiwanensis]RXE55062.1 hypothetical protein ABH15_13440 [Methanoculleus taiwanensis]
MAFARRMVKDYVQKYYPALQTAAEADLRACCAADAKMARESGSVSGEGGVVGFSGVNFE